jgi:hypothetical protein
MRSAEDSQPLKFCGEKEGDQVCLGKRRDCGSESGGEGKNNFRGHTNREEGGFVVVNGEARSFFEDF